MKNNRQIGLDGRIFITDCLNDGVFFIYSILLSGFLGAAGDIMKLLGQSSHAMSSLTNGLILCDLVCSLSMVIVTYYVYFMHCGENIPKLGTKPLIYLEYLRLGYYVTLAYEVLYRMAKAWQPDSKVSAAIPIFYVFYFAWLLCCVCAAMFILTVLHQNVIRRSYAQSFKWLSLIGLGFNVVLPLAYFITRIWVRGGGDGFYSAGLCDFVRLALAPIFYAAIWFLFMNAIDQVDKVFNEVDSAIRDKRYRIEYEEESGSRRKKSKSDKKKAKKKTETPVPQAAEKAQPTESAAAEPISASEEAVVPSAEPENIPAAVGDIVIESAEPTEPAEESEPEPTEPAEKSEPVPTESEPSEPFFAAVLAEQAGGMDASVPEASDESPEDTEDEAGAKRVRPKKKHRITQIEEEITKVKASKKEMDDLTSELFETLDAVETSDAVFVNADAEEDND